MKKLTLILTMFLGIAIMAYSQGIVVSGTVTDELGDELIGASVVVKGTTTGVMTDLDGSYTITVPEGRNTLVYSLLGMNTKEMKVPNHNGTINVVLETADAFLDEVVVTGYGSYKKSAYAGSAATVRTENMEDIPAVDFSTMLQGNASGVQINSVSGQPGATTDIMIRGLGSFNASTSPLMVIDGIPVISGNVNRQYSDVGADIMSTINPSDIENITVIKDAAAASLYGSRAANGVILITTKSGKKGKATFTLKSDWGYSDKAMKYRPFMGGAERRETLLEGLGNFVDYWNEKEEENAANIPGYKPEYYDRDTYPAENIDKYAPIPASGYADWEDALFRKGSHQNYEFSANGGDDNMSYYSSLGYTESEGISYQSDFRRISSRVNVKYKMTNWLELGANVMFSNIKQHINSEGTSYVSPIYAVYHKVSPSDPIYNEDGSYNENLLANKHRNPKADADLNPRTQRIERSFNTIFANFNIMDGLTANTTLSYDQNVTDYKSWDDPRTSAGLADGGSLSRSYYKYRTLVWKNNATYIKEFAEKHHLDVLAGFEIDMYERDGLYVSTAQFPNVSAGETSNHGQIKSVSGYPVNKRMVSYLSRANYNFMEKYFLGASVRVDASSQLHKESRWGTFWSVSGAWRLSSEPFMDAVKDVISDTRIRASYGINGTLPPDYFGYMNLVSYGDKYLGQSVMYQSALGNKDLKWEKNHTLNLGLDFKLFKKLGVTLEYFQRTTKDLLMDMPISGTTGFTSYLTNVGEVKNRGVEVELSADIFRTKDFSWFSSFNLGHVKNKITKLSGEEEIRSSEHVHRVGHPYYSYYLYQFAGINPDNGNILYYINKEGQAADAVTEDYNEAERILYKGADPTISGGWTNTLKYKFVDLSTTFSFTFGGYSYDYGASKLAHGGAEPEHNIQTYYRDRWKKPGDNATYEKFITGGPTVNVASTRRVHSTDHIRLKNITVGLTLPKQWSNAVGIGNVRAYFSAVNLLTWASYDNYDPEVSKSGRAYFQSPTLKTLTFGIDIKF